MNILEKANEIVNLRSEEKERQYGPMDESLKKVSVIATELCNKEITTEDVYKVLISLKLSRMAYNHKEDTYVDMVAYISAFFNFKTNTNDNSKQSS